MRELTSELKQEHQEISKMLIELQQVGATTTKGFNLLLKTKDKLLSHIEKEDNELYPLLYNEAKSNSSLEKTLITFAGEMNKISEFIFGFYNKYSKGSFDKNEFRKDITTYIVSLKGRIMKEEIVIYKAYEKLLLKK